MPRGVARENGVFLGRRGGYAAQRAVSTGAHSWAPAVLPLAGRCHPHASVQSIFDTVTTPDAVNCRGRLGRMHAATSLSLLQDPLTRWVESCTDKLDNADT